jgi:hypothetical protein
MWWRFRKLFRSFFEKKESPQSEKNSNTITIPSQFRKSISFDDLINELNNTKS